MPEGLLVNSTFLKTVWADSVVAEQVVFQSINELRQIFTNQEVIKTIPKQGYVWLPDVSTIYDLMNQTIKPTDTLLQ